METAKQLKNRVSVGGCRITWSELTKTLAEHDDVDALWVFGSDKASAEAERLSASNLKRTLVDHGLATDWFDVQQAEGPLYLRHATQVKNVWIPYGE